MRPPRLWGPRIAATRRTEALRDAADPVADRSRRSGDGAGSGLKRLGGGAGQHIGLAVQRRDQAVDALVPENRGELGAAGRHLADGAVEVDVGDQPGIAVLAHQIVDLDGLAVRFDDLTVDDDTGGGRLLVCYLQLLPGIAVE